MKKISFRIFLVFIAIAAGTLIFMLISYAGDKSKGPFQDFITSVNSGFASMEKSWASGKENRTEDLKWFDRYRNNPAVLNTTDTLILGIYDDHSLNSFQNIVNLEDTLQANLPVISFYTAWGSRSNQQFPLLKAKSIYDLGSMPMITWEPWLDDFDPSEFPVIAGKEDKNKGGLKLITEGRFDSYIIKWAEAAKKFRHPFFLRWGHEMNDPYRYPWGPHNNSPEDYILAWQYIVNKFREVGAGNVIWIWSPHIAYDTSSQYYPGNDYVDWIGLTTLNYGTVAPWSQWWSFEEIFDKGYNEFSTYDRPMMISEFGSLDVGGDRAVWYKEALDAISGNYPVVKSVVFFHASNDNTTTYKTLDWSIISNRDVIRAVKTSLEGNENMSN
ncbi:hypothetical protein BH23BAC2_BH23BAC2_05740 [soil metagenome]